MLKLFSVVLGGRATGCNIELHDVVFVIGHSIEETYPQLVNKWFGHKKQLHVDSFIELKYIDRHEIIISREKPKNSKKLFFVNFGAYQPGYFGEVHAIDFYVGSDKPNVLARAKKNLCVDLIEPHCDDNLYVDDIMAFQKIDQYYLHLVPSAKPAAIEIISDYRRLDLPDILAQASV
jgi:hypothetical protein